MLDDQGQPYLPALAAGTSLKWDSWSDAEAGQGEDGAGADPEAGATWYLVPARAPARTVANPIARRPNMSESHSETPEH